MLPNPNLLTRIESPGAFQVVLVAIRSVVAATDRVPFPHILRRQLQRLCQVLHLLAAPLHWAPALAAPLLQHICNNNNNNIRGYEGKFRRQYAGHKELTWIRTERLEGVLVRLVGATADVTHFELHARLLAGLLPEVPAQ